MSALLTTPNDLENVASHSKGAHSTVTDLGLDDSSPEVEAQEADQGSGTKPSSAGSEDQAIKHPEVDTNPYIPTGFKIENHPIDARPQLKVAVIGAGISGINAGILLPVKVPGIQLTIFEKNADVGGTWLENIYPGVRCDIPANVYQSTFAQNTQWSQEYAEGKEIREYWQGVARDYDVYKYIKFHRRIQRAEWDSVTAQWRLNIQDTSSGLEYGESFDVLITAIGVFNAWRLPNYPGIQDYEGHLRHTSNWDPSFDPTGKTVAVIGNGASGIQVLPQIQKVAKHVDHYARSKTWIAGSFGSEKRTDNPAFFSEDRLNSFKDPETYLKFRKELEGTFYRNFFRIFRDTKEHTKSRQKFIELITERLAKKPELLQDFIPDFAPFCRRLTPGPGYLEALTEENVDYITTPIQKFTRTGIVTADGVSRDVDAVICATGANVDFAPPFPIVANGIDLNKAWKPDGSYGSPYAYFGVAAPYFPNLFFLLGPNSGGISGTLGHYLEHAVTYIAKVLRKISNQGIRTITPSKAATDDFIEYVDTFFEQTVLTDGCSSWYNGGIPGQRIHGAWPGSGLHTTKARLDPRWEDFEYTYRSQQKNRFAWFGGGFVEKELVPDSDLTPYLRKPTEIDLRDYHERWHEYE